MCHLTVELQELWHPKVGDTFVRPIEGGDGYSDLGIVIAHNTKLDGVWLPSSDQLYLICRNDYKGKHGQVASNRGLIADINDWHGLNEWAWDWELRQILLAYWMRTVHKQCWDIVSEEWVDIDETRSGG